ncbi:MAG TPA: tRNA pseudouridine(55) synthase TruB [Polyangiaceae bacterium]|jgi:tRNA pseudouridine55 synthase|nr:tRNA pseudouridine(55) synthase TruB [Polyangiaceae bacterium]
MSGRHGLLVVDKPRGVTSHDVVAQARRLFRERAVGHAGTLDPMATGVLVLLFGEACKLSGHLTGQDKVYLASVQFGVGTDSFDADGRIVERMQLSPSFPDPTQLEAALRLERARSEQVPPAVSAIHHEGERAHVRARRGETVELPARPVHVTRLELLKLGTNSLDLELSVSKGYYVRALARDLGAALGAPAHLSALRRSASGSFTLADAVTWPATEAPPLLPLADAARRALPVTKLSAEAVTAARQGKRIPLELAQASSPEQLSAWLSPEGELVALGVSLPDGTHRVVRGIVPA